MVEDDATRGTRAAPGAPTLDGNSAASTAPVGHGNDETIVPSWGGASAIALPDPGYQLGALIGRGGMGEVVTAQDQRIGREVAVKRIRSKSPTHDAVTRFLREARIQARLDHPAIVPVYELGTDTDGRPYFTMKRLAGVTLAKRLSEGTPPQPLLRAFVDVCLAIELAHSRGVVHRDLKPSNIMLGDYGEVYVLDWGVARVITETTRETRPQIAVEHDESTTAGAILGTPGYMSPEQVRSEDVGPAADVYSLGSILFEILAGQPLHPRGEAALATTLTSPQTAPTKRALDRQIPPELDSACFDSLADEASRRPSARKLAERVQAYLDGDRDVERRRAMASDQLAAAREALISSAADARAAAMQHAGRALALDPSSAEAAQIVTSLMLEPPNPIPRELVVSLDAEDRAYSSDRARVTFAMLASLFSFWVIVPFLSVKSWSHLLAFYGLVALGMISAWRVIRSGRTRIVPTLLLMTCLMIAFSRILSPFILMPIAACAVLTTTFTTPEFAKGLWLVLGWACVAMLLPIALERLGLIAATYTIVPGVVTIDSDAFNIRGTAIDELALVFTNTFYVSVIGVVAYKLNERRVRAQRQLHIQAWHLKQLLPSTQPATGDVTAQDG